MSLSSEEEAQDQFATGGPLLAADDGDPNDVSSSDLSSDDEPSPHPAAHAPTQAQMLSFGPPYYGRPPTPLPPSPSLTSLLRPSRPTTPNASDDEGGHGGHGGHGTGTGTGPGPGHGPGISHGGHGRGDDGSRAGSLHTVGGGDGHAGAAAAAAAAAPPHHAHPVPRASPKVPTYEYYGFVLYLLSSCCFLMYLLWSYLPSPFLHALGIHYYPDRWWSLATPAFLVVLLVYVYAALALYNTEYLTLPLRALETIVDDAGMLAVVDGRGRIVGGEARRRALERERARARERDGEGRRRQQQQQQQQRTLSATCGGGGARAREREVDWRECWNEGTDAVMDVPLAGVCEVLYGGARVEELGDELGD